jgi:DNA-binding NtrC family response regulator
MGKQVIVCVDDESIVLNSLEMQLRRLLGDSVHFEFAENAVDAYDIIDELNSEGKKIALVITDWLMPGMKGDELLLKIHRKYPRIKKVLLTGQADPSALEHVLKISGVVLHKPWKEQDILSIIEHVR